MSLRVRTGAWLRLALLWLALLAACGGDDLGVVPPTGDVEGYVCDPVSGDLARGATVSGEGLNGTVEAVADDTGFFDLENLATGSQVLTVAGEGGSFTATVSVEVVEDETTRLPDPPCLDPPTGSVSGRICASETQIGSGEGYWLANAEVSITSGDGVHGTTTDADGWFILEEVPIGNHVLVIRKGSFSGSEEVTVHADETTPLTHVCVTPTTPMAVITGQFDSIQAVLQDLGFGLRACDAPALDPACPAAPVGDAPVSLFDGEVAVATCQTSGCYATTLFGTGALLDFDILFFNCGLSDVVLDVSLESDLQTFVSQGGSIYVSDYAYNLIRVHFPDVRIDFYGDDGTADRAKVGEPDTTSVATVEDPVLAAVVGETVDILFDAASNDWVVMEPVQPPEVEVLIRGDVEIDPDGDGTAEVLAGAPLLVAVPVGEGRIVFTSFHNHAQISAAMDEILRYLVFEL